MEDTAASKEVLEQLKALGVRIALDDFGTGYSSLSYLARLPIDALKIDRSFIRDLGSGGRGETVTAAIIALSQSLGIDVVVEGVEEAEQLAFVGRHGTAEVQGFFFARPMAPAALEIWRIAYEARRAKRPVAA
jgi:EAL domain-containing protein (putative c-di-GMP-specific phosphodiesterase class I)